MFVVKYQNDHGEIKVFDKYEDIEDAYDAVDNLVEKYIVIEDEKNHDVIYKEGNLVMGKSS